MVVQAAEAVTQNEPIAATAAPAGEKAGKKRHGPPGRVQALRPGLPHTDGGRFEQAGNVPLAEPRRLPERVIDDAQMRRLSPDPLALRVRARDAPAGRGVLDVALPVPDQDPGIEFIVENAGTARDVAADTGVAPGPAERAGNTFLVQFDRDGLRALAGGEGSEDAPNDFSLSRDNLAIAPDRLAAGIELLHHAVAVAEATTGLALLHPAAQAAMGLQGEVLEEQGVHGALEADMELTDLAFSEGDDGNSREAQMLEQRGDIGLIARDPVEGLGQHYFELPALCIPQQRLDAVP